MRTSVHARGGVSFLEVERSKRATTTARPGGVSLRAEADEIVAGNAPKEPASRRS